MLFRSEYGYLCLGSRLKRMGERFQAGVQALNDDHGFPVQTSHYPILGALHERGPMGVSDLAEAVGIAQPGVTRAAARLAELGLVEAIRAGRDQRQKSVRLTDAGRRLVLRAQALLWPAIERAVREMCLESGLTIDMVDRLEDMMQAQPMEARANAMLQKAGAK